MAKSPCCTFCGRCVSLVSWFMATAVADLVSPGWGIDTDTGCAGCGWVERSVLMCRTHTCKQCMLTLSNLFSKRWVQLVVFSDLLYDYHLPGTLCHYLLGLQHLCVTADSGFFTRVNVRRRQQERHCMGCDGNI